MLMDAQANEIQDQIKGLTVDQAENFLKNKKLQLRVMRENGKHHCGTCDYCTDRVNVEVAGDKIVSVMGIG